MLRFGSGWKGSGEQAPYFLPRPGFVVGLAFLPPFAGTPAGGPRRGACRRRHSCQDSRADPCWPACLHFLRSLDRGASRADSPALCRLRALQAAQARERASSDGSPRSTRLPMTSSGTASERPDGALFARSLTVAPLTPWRSASAPASTSSADDLRSRALSMALFTLSIRSACSAIDLAISFGSTPFAANLRARCSSTRAGSSWARASAIVASTF